MSGTPGTSVTEVEHNMSGYFSTTVKSYIKDTGKKLRKVDTPHAPKVDSQAFDANLMKPGELTQRQCASHLK